MINDLLLYSLGCLPWCRLSISLCLAATTWGLHHFGILWPDRFPRKTQNTRYKTGERLFSFLGAMHTVCSRSCGKRGIRSDSIVSVTQMMLMVALLQEGVHFSNSPPPLYMTFHIWIASCVNLGDSRCLIAFNLTGVTWSLQKPLWSSCILPCHSCPSPLVQFCWALDLYTIKEH